MLRESSKTDGTDVAMPVTTTTTTATPEETANVIPNVVLPRNFFVSSNERTKVNIIAKAKEFVKSLGI